MTRQGRVDLSFADMNNVKEFIGKVLVLAPESQGANLRIEVNTKGDDYGSQVVVTGPDRLCYQLVNLLISEDYYPNLSDELDAYAEALGAKVSWPGETDKPLFVDEPKPRFCPKHPLTKLMVHDSPGVYECGDCLRASDKRAQNEDLNLVAVPVKLESDNLADLAIAFLRAHLTIEELDGLHMMEVLDGEKKGEWDVVFSGPPGLLKKISDLVDKAS